MTWTCTNGQARVNLVIASLSRSVWISGELWQTALAGKRSQLGAWDCVTVCRFGSKGNSASNVEGRGPSVQVKREPLLAVSSFSILTRRSSARCRCCLVCGNPVVLGASVGPCSPTPGPGRLQDAPKAQLSATLSVAIGHVGPT